MPPAPRELTLGRAVSGIISGLSLALLTTVAPGCVGAEVESVIGVDGGELKAGKLTVVIPPGALVAERTLSLVKVDEDLSEEDFVQSEKSYELRPKGLVLKIPAEITYTTGSDIESPSVLYQLGDRVTAFPAVGEAGKAHVNRFGTVNVGGAGALLGSIDEPTLVQLPGDIGAEQSFVDSVHMKITPADSSAFDLVLTAYDMEGNYNRPLNDNEDDKTHCGFNINHNSVVGGLITGGCINGSVTASISPTAPSVEFDIQPFLIGKTDESVAVAVGIGVGKFVTNIGYFEFKTGKCFGESCSGYGVCDASGGDPVCNCFQQYAPGEEPLSCVCVPDCSGKECGGNGCGGGCGDCGEGFNCVDDSVCMPQDPPPTTSDTGTGSTTGSTGMPTTGSTGMPTTTGSTGMTTTGSTGMPTGSSSGSSSSGP